MIMALTRATKQLIPTRKEIEYPESDGKHVGETGVHINVATLGLMDVIRRFYGGNLNVAVHSNLFVYYVQGDPKRNVCPDLFVALMVRRDINRRTFKVWEEGKGPDAVIEVTSKKTRRADKAKKFELYRDVLKVREYFLFDPFEEYLEPSLQGYRLVEGQYEPIAAVGHRLPSEVLGLHLERDGVDLRLYNPQTGFWEPTSDEVEAAWRGAEVARREAEAARHEAETRSHRDEEEIQRLRGELDSLRKKQAE
jgi:Uma2 family endonuclease